MLQSRIFRVVVSVVLTAGILGLLLVNLEDERERRGYTIGVVIDTSEGVLRIAEVAPSGPAAKAGIQEGDVIIGVGGTRLESTGEYDRQLRNTPPGEPISYLLQRNGGTAGVSVKPGVRMPWFPFVIKVFTALCYAGIGLLSLFQRPGDLRARLLFLFAFAVAVELALPAFSFGPVSWTVASGAAFMLLSGLEMSVELHLASVIPSRQAWIASRPWVVPGYYILGVGFGVVSVITYVTDQIDEIALPWTGQDIGALLDVVLLPAWAVAVTGLLAAQALRHPSADGRHQAGLVLLGVLPWAIFIVVSTIAGGRFIGSSAVFEAVETLVLLSYPIAIFFAIYLYHLFDIELVVRRGMVYGALSAVLVMVFYVILSTGGMLAATLAGESPSVWVVSAATLLLGLMFAPLRGAVQRMIDRRFFPERYALRERLIGLAGELAALGELPRMARHLTGQLRSIFGAGSVTILIAEPEAGVLSLLASTRPDLDPMVDQTFLLALDDPAIEYLQRAGRPVLARAMRQKSANLERCLGELKAVLAVPVLSRHNLIGLLLLGKKETKDRYPGEELELLALLSHQVATTFENARLFQLATFDGLTGLLRREATLRQLERELERAARYHRPLTIGMADLDHFKVVNDEHGHLTGDAMLKRVSHVLRSSLRATDTVGRYGGEEFLIVLPETALAPAMAVAEKVRRAIQDTSVRAADGREVRTTISIGLASLTAGDGEAGQRTVESIVAAADAELFAAKQQGRNRVWPQTPPLINPS